MAQLEKKHTEQSVKSSANFDLGDFSRSMELGSLKSLKGARDELDAGIPKILSLSAEERDHLAARALGASMAVTTRRSIQAVEARFAGGSSKVENKASKSESLMNELAIGLRIDITGMSPQAKKAYESEIKTVWKEAMAALNEILETPTARKLLEPKPKQP